MSSEPLEDHGLCASCHERLVGRYCHRCGERVVDPRDYTIRHFAEQAFETVTHLDGKLWRTFRTAFRDVHARGRLLFLVTFHLS